MSVENPHVQRVQYCRLLVADFLQRVPSGRRPSIVQVRGRRRMLNGSVRLMIDAILTVSIDVLGFLLASLLRVDYCYYY